MLNKPTYVEEHVIDIDFYYLGGTVSNLTLLPGDQLELPNQLAPHQYIRAILQNKLFGGVPETVTIPVRNVLYWSTRQTTRRFAVPPQLTEESTPPPPSSIDSAPAAPDNLSHRHIDYPSAPAGRHSRQPRARA